MQTRSASLGGHECTLRLTIPVVVAVLTLLGGVALLVTSAPAFACIPQNFIELRPASGPAGTVVEISGHTYAPGGGEVLVYWDWQGGPVIGRSTVDEHGTFATQVTIPEAAGGHYVIKALQLDESGNQIMQPTGGLHGFEVTVPTAGNGNLAAPYVPEDPPPAAEPSTDRAPALEPSTPADEPDHPGPAVSTGAKPAAAPIVTSPPSPQAAITRPPSEATAASSPADATGAGAAQPSPPSAGIDDGAARIQPRQAARPAERSFMLPASRSLAPEIRQLLASADPPTTSSPSAHGAFDRPLHGLSLQAGDVATGGSRTSSDTTAEHPAPWVTLGALAIAMALGMGFLAASIGVRDRRQRVLSDVERTS